MTNDIDFDVLARWTNEFGGAISDLNNLFGAAFPLLLVHASPTGAFYVGFVADEAK